MTRGDFFKCLETLEAYINEFLMDENNPLGGKFSVDKDGAMGNKQMEIARSSPSFFALTFDYSIYYEEAPMYMDAALDEGIYRICEYILETASEQQPVFNFFGGYDTASMTRHVMIYVVNTTLPDTNG